MRKTLAAAALVAAATTLGGNGAAQAYGVCASSSGYLLAGTARWDHPWTCYPRPDLPVPPSAIARTCVDEQPTHRDSVEVCAALWP